MRSTVCALLSVGSLIAATQASAGPIIIDGTDANEHGFVQAGVNQDGWLYMQKALENLALQLGAGVPKSVLTLGMTPSGAADLAFDSAFNLSSLPGGGWTRTDIDGDLAIDAALAGLSTAGTGLLYIPTYQNLSGDLDFDEMAAVNARAVQIANFVNSGGALFAMGESGEGAWGWLTTLIPGLVATDVGGGGVASNITLTAAGVAAFPGLSNTELAGADPWHGHFSGNLGSLAALGVADFGGPQNVIIGGGATATITPTPGVVPEPGSLLLLGTGAAALYRRMRATKKKT
jgi:hypothetical protein